MYRGTLFILLFYGLAPGITLFLLWVCVRRVLGEADKRVEILLAAALALAVWTLATYFMFALTFGRAWVLAHTRPLPEGIFPEGWTIYGFLGAYAALGATIAVVLHRVPSASALPDTAHDQASTVFDEFRNVAVLSLPTIIGTGFFLVGVLISNLDDFNGAPPISWEEPSGLRRMVIGVLFALYLACYFGAAFGPVLLPLAGYKAFALTRAVGLRRTIAIWTWAFVVLGFAAAALFWGWLIHLDILV